ncbi:unnamed protein product [Sphagnum jensenii]|uniref:Uncharacterized protein n=1 Tax=Sphagnum jensenii TaxID=128206 RepID=A0ABP0WBQ3_9BRYO
MSFLHPTVFQKILLWLGARRSLRSASSIFFFLVKISLLVFSISSPVAAEEDDHSYIGPFFFFWLASCRVVGRSD